MILKKGTVTPTEPLGTDPPHTPDAIARQEDAQLNDDLIRRARDGDDSAFGSLVEIYEKFVFNTACRTLTASGLGTSDAEDIAQASFLKAWRSLSAFRGDCTFSTWLYRITINTARDFIRSHARHGTVSLTVEDSEDGEESVLDIPVTSGDEVPEDAVDKRETINAVREAISELPEDQRNVIILRDIHELPYHDIAERLNIEIGTVKSRINRGRQALKALLMKKNIF